MTMACPDNVEMMAAMSQKLTFLENYIRRPIWFNRASGALNVTPVSGTITTVSTVTSVTQKAGIDLGTTELRWEMKNRWNLAVRGRIS